MSAEQDPAETHQMKRDQNRNPFAKIVQLIAQIMVDRHQPIEHQESPVIDAPQDK